ncbi:hypothetical protein C7444_12410 [Sphaerotilus hippei]|uniref:Uncharacterized protein n=1 Tax=Sphaerotilus hippei TaxID=744406 RepID=A0A318GVD6_9BURK|nr:hypothetical protein [Sphaerotilus hippei]PXW92401.1 hypothetical protein C7444_12410 [Sphaerotilus hippei]
MPTLLRTLICTTAAGLCLSLAPLSQAATKAAKKTEAAAPAPLPELSEEQLSNAGRVLTGDQACEFNQTVKVEPNAKSGYFDMDFKGKKYVLAPEPTTTGAVRLEDKKNGLVWIQIANKSMLMNSKIGRRLVDECVHPSQKA